MSKLYVCDAGTPNGSPNGDGKKAEVDDASQSSSSSNRSGQREFKDAIRKRDNECVFCASRAEPLEAAHIIPVEQKDILNDHGNCTRYGVCSIMDTANGVLLCWACHKCFDANLVCINSVTGVLTISEALLSNEPEKWNPLVGRVVPASSSTWPSTAMLQYRETALLKASEDRQRHVL